MRAAVANGANAVYFGLNRFNARARAHNFDVAELPAIMAYLHQHNVRGFVTFNVLVFSDELPSAVEMICACAEAGVDALIVQDLGIVQLAKRLAPSLPIHGSTQMTLTEPRGIAFVAALGVERVVLARELALPDIQRICQQTTTPVEVFVHGALCVAYSGQCLTSEALGGRSANRGQCAQACRLPYELLVDGQPRDLGDRAYLLSPQDLAAYDLMADLVHAGVISFKIEGRLKGGPYVAATTKTYRTALDAALAEQSFQLNRREELDLAQTFSRGLTHGFLDGVNHQTLVRGRFPKSRGIRVGTVVELRGANVVIRSQEAVPNLIKAGDGLLFDLGTPEMQEPGGRVWRCQSDATQSTYTVSFEPGSEITQHIPLGCPVWKTDDPELKKRLEQSYKQDRLVHRTPVTAHLTGQLGGPLTLTLTLSTDSDVSAVAIWPGPLEAARNKPHDPREVEANLARLGDTPFRLVVVEISIPRDAMLPKSVLNDLRRQASKALILQLKRRHAVQAPQGLEELRAVIHDRPRRPQPSEPQLTILVRNLEQLRTVLTLRPAQVMCDFEDLRRYAEAVPLARAAGVPIALATNRIWKPGEDGFQSLVVRAQPDAVLIRNLASIRYFQEQLPGARLVGDFSLNVANELTSQVLLDAGLERLVPSYDLNWQQLEAMVRRSDPRAYEPVIHQHMPMFHMEHCVFAAFMSTGKDHRDCGRPCERHRVELRDRVGAEFPVHPDTGCRNTVYNSVPQSAAEYVGRMKELGIRWFRIDLLRESADDIVSLVAQYRRVLHGDDDGKQTWKQLRAINQLGVTRGTLNLL
jgi:putative protease